MSSLSHALQDRFHHFIDRTQKHTKGHFSFPWLHPQNQSFTLLPDYLKLHQFAPTPFRKWANNHLTPLPKLWNKIVWPKIFTSVTHTLEHKYLVDLAHNHNAHKTLTPHTKSDLLTPLKTLLHNPPTDLRFSTFTDLYYFLNDTLKIFCTHLNLPMDIYAPNKASHNNICLKLYKTIRTDVLSHPQAFELACYLAIRANWIDCVEDNVSGHLVGFSEEANQIIDNPEAIQLNIHHNPYFHLTQVKAKLSTPQTILYELDNAGEVLLDLIFIEHLLTLGHTIILGAKAQPVLNDLTYTELTHLFTHPELAHLNAYRQTQQLQLFNTDSIVPGKYLPHASEAYKGAYAQATLLILKGQGNFQTMPMGQKIKKRFTPYPYAKPIVYMLGMKAPFIAACFSSILKKGPHPLIQMPFLYLFDPNDPRTYPK